ncbi:class I SAM-dependent methyltransferase [Methylobacterium goesingense]|uniref:SAM-dependent methyltransferase n=1 Tax=Methylobacterium goesingense TaxID=243690 RepID=A0ABV2LB17_9HYPH|nr:class I SAM-dependent methyltransferase [Methylobacterium goesingense]GJD76323.1 Trans-aconitate 2-methyltransferase [Methylobacterium goesingense]
MTRFSAAQASREPAEDPVSLTFEAPGRVRGAFPPDVAHPGRVTVACDGRSWATVPVRADGAGASFTCDLPPVGLPTQVRVEVRDADRILGRLTAQSLPKRNAGGLDALSVHRVCDSPLFSVPWMQFDGARLTISGAHLPPAGNPDLLSVCFDEGVRFTFDYGLQSPEFENHFWYWPNAGLSNFVLTIDLAGSRPGSNPFRFTFSYPGAETGLQDVPVPVRSIGRRISVPTDMSLSVCFPRDATQLTRVQTWSNDQSVTFTGYSTFRALEALFAHYGVANRTGTAILDWGCGHGRVTRHFIGHWRQAQISGADIDAENVAWCGQNLGGRFTTVPLFPPTDLPEASFDGIFGVSVMTHLTDEAQAAWLDEIARLLKPDGIALITFAGAAATAFSSVFRSAAWWQAWEARGFDDAQHDPALDGKIGNDTYYRNTLHTMAYTRAHWSKHVEVVDIIPSAIGYQDMAVLRRRR